MKKIFLIAFIQALLIMPNILMAQQNKKNVLRIHPIAGYSHSNSRTTFIYGGRILYGPKLYSAELEVTSGKNTYNHSSQNLKTEEKKLTGMLGLRSEIGLFKNAFSIGGRAGASVRKTETINNKSGIITTKENTQVSPYAGATASLRAFQALYVNAGITVIFTGSDSNAREYQTTLGISLRM